MFCNVVYCVLCVCILCVVCYVLCVICCVLCVIWCVLCVVWCVLFAVCCVLYVVYCIVCIVCYVLYIYIYMCVCALCLSLSMIIRCVWGSWRCPCWKKCMYRVCTGYWSLCEGWYSSTLVGGRKMVGWGNRYSYRCEALAFGLVDSVLVDVWWIYSGRQLLWRVLLIIVRFGISNASVLCEYECWSGIYIYIYIYIYRVGER